MLDYFLEPVCSLTLWLRLPDIVGPTDDGLRIDFRIDGGDVEGPLLNGRVLPEGGDRFLLRTDGVGILDVEMALETHDGIRIDLRYGGVAETGFDGYERFMGSEPPLRIPLRATPRLHCADPVYAWVNRLQFLAIGEADLAASRVRYDLYAVR